MWPFCKVIVTVRFRCTVESCGTIANVLEVIVTCEIVLTYICGVGNVEICLTCKGNSAGSNTMMDWGPLCRCNWLVENQSIQIRQL